MTRLLKALRCAPLFSVLLASSSASATPLFETMGPAASNGGFSPVVSDPSSASAYFNPAMLSDAEERFDVGIAVLSEQISITLDGRPSGSDVPLEVGARDVIYGPPGNIQQLPNTVIPTQWLTQGCQQGTRVGQCPAQTPPNPRQSQGTSGVTRPYLVVGGVKHLIKNRLSVGAYVMLPLSNLTTATAFFNDEREALFSNSLHPELYGDRLTAMSIAVGASFRLLKTLSLGIGASLGLANSATSASYVPSDTDYSQLLVNNTIGVTAALSPHAGAYWTPNDRVRIGAVIHAPESFEIDTTITAELPNGTVASGIQHEVHDYMPWRISLGGEADLIRSRNYTFGIAAGLTWENWSTYQDRHGAEPGSYYGNQDVYGWHDTVTWSVGVRHRYKKLRTYIDWQYKPTPVPAQVGRTNYVDSDRYGVAFGGDLDFMVGGVHLRPGLQLVAYRLAWSEVTKNPNLIPDEVPDDARHSSTGDPVAGAQGLQTNNPGYPGFGSEGWIYGGTASLTVLF
jgi:long-chain fatty acid transport protein